MKYILIDKEDWSEEETTREEALKLIAKYYRNPEYVLQEAERLFGNRINTTFTIIEIR